MAHTGLTGMERKISRVLGGKPEYFVTHPAELAIVNSLQPEELDEFARDRGWRVVSRVGGRQIEFYNDVTAKQDAPGTQPP